MAIRTGEEYLEGLHDTREIWLGGERVADVTTHPLLANMARSVADYYDLQHRPEHREAMTYRSESGDIAHLSFLAPRSVADLRRRNDAMRRWAEVHCGFMGRSPDYMNICVMALGTNADYFAQDDPRFGQNVQRYYALCRERDLCLTHTLVPIQTGRATPPREQPPHVHLSVVEENTHGVIVKGARMLATLAPFSDELVNFAQPLLTHPEEDIYALAFAIPVATPGLRFICRDSFDRQGSRFDRPVSSRFDEMDAIAVFDNVLIPWERLFIYRNLELHNRIVPATKFLSHIAVHVAIKDAVKSHFLVGLSHLLAQSIGVNGFVNVQEKLGEIVTYARLVDALLVAMTEQAQPDEHGIYVPAADLGEAFLNIYPQWYPRMIEIIKLVGAGGLMMTPSEHDVAALPEDIATYFQSTAGLTGVDRVRLNRLVWDVCGSEFGGRQELYERFFAGAPTRRLSQTYVRANLESDIRLVEGLLGVSLPVMQ
jgi:4-hydroxyphenylacetate 3-monooxygenase